MKEKLTLIMFFFTCYSAICQTLHPIKAKDSTNLYYQCLREHMRSIKGVGAVYVEERFPITDNLPTSIDGIKVQYLSTKELMQLLKSIKTLYVVGIQQIDGNIGGLKLNISDFSVLRKQKRLNYIFTGGSTFDIIYDCTANEYYIKSVGRRGI